MSEILDFIIELIGVFSGSNRNYKKEFEKAISMSPDEQKIVIDCFNNHIAKDPITANISYSYLYVILRKKNMKVVALDNQYKKVFAACFKPRFASNWHYGKIEL